MNSVATFFKNMQSAMDSQAIEVWEMVEYSRSAGNRLRLGEVTLTELNFYKLREFWTKTVYIDTNEPDESKTGADWEWLIGYSDRWLQIRVQAKVINRNGSFTELGHKTKSSARLQMDTLINPPEDEVACHWMPLYVFYTATPPSKAPLTSQLHGCSAKLARKVRDVYSSSTSGQSTLTSKEHLKDSVPWSEVFSGLLDRLEDQLDDEGKISKAGESLHAVINDLADKKVPTTIGSINDFWTSDQNAQKCDKELPAYLQAIVAQHNDSFSSASAARLEVKITNHEELSNLVRVDAQARYSTWATTGSSEEAETQTLPARTISLQRLTPDRQQVSLPSFVSVLDISKLPFEAGAPEA